MNSRKQREDILIIGGGASGLTAAISAARNGARVTVLEAGKKPGLKLLRSGNGRCNLSNAGSFEHVYEGADPAFAEKVLISCPRTETNAFWESLGLVLFEKNGWIYPRNEEASYVRACLLEEAERLGVRIRNQSPVSAVGREEGGFFVRQKDWTYHGKKLILACGSPAGISEKEPLSILKLAEDLGISVLPFTAGLTGLKICGTKKELAGVRANAALSLCDNGTVADREEGQIQFTASGISGICVFNLALKAGSLLEKGRDLSVICDFVPDADSLFTDRPLLKKDLRGILPEKLYAALFAELSEEEALRLVRAYPMRPEKLLPLSGAQAARGGILTEQVEPTTMAARGIDGLFLCGEMLDIAGKCGGWNLQFAWSTGLLAGRSAAASLAEPM